MDFQTLLEKDSMSLFSWLIENFKVELPAQICSSKDMEQAGELLLKLSSYYAYLLSLSSYAKIKVREAKRSGDKTTHEDMIDKKDTIQSMTDIIKQQYVALSRAVTIHIENNAELKMGRCT